MHIIFSARCDYSSRSSIEYLSNINAYTDPSACLNINKLQMLDRVPPYQRSNEYILVWIVSHKARKLLNILSLPPLKGIWKHESFVCDMCACAVRSIGDHGRLPRFAFVDSRDFVENRPSLMKNDRRRSVSRLCYDALQECIQREFYIKGKMTKLLEISCSIIFKKKIL